MSRAYACRASSEPSNPSTVFALSKNSALPSASTASSRRSTVKGSTTFWYSDRLKSPRRISATDQISAAPLLSRPSSVIWEVKRNRRGRGFAASPGSATVWRH